MNPIPIKINLGPVRLTFVIGDADHNGAIDVTLAVRIVNVFEFTFPPLNLDAALADTVKRDFEALASKFAPVKK